MIEIGQKRIWQYVDFENDDGNENTLRYYTVTGLFDGNSICRVVYDNGVEDCILTSSVEKDRLMTDPRKSWDIHDIQSIRFFTCLEGIGMIIKDREGNTETTLKPKDAPNPNEIFLEFE